MHVATMNSPPADILKFSTWGQFNRHVGVKYCLWEIKGIL